MSVVRAATNCGAISGLAAAGSGAAEPSPSDGVALSLGLSARTVDLWLTAVRHRRRADELAARDSGAVSL